MLIFVKVYEILEALCLKRLLFVCVLIGLTFSGEVKISCVCFTCAYFGVANKNFTRITSYNFILFISFNLLHSYFATSLQVQTSLKICAIKNKLTRLNQMVFFLWSLHSTYFSTKNGKLIRTLGWFYDC